MNAFLQASGTLFANNSFYYGIETKDTIWASVSVFDTADGARESDELASSFIQEKSWVEVLSAPEITAGDVVAQ